MKRFVCFLLALILIVGMVPATAVIASAASDRTTSDKAVNILKGSAVFYSKEESGKVGYSTPSSYSEAKKYLNGISQEDALALMRSYLKEEVDEAINKFTKDYNVDLTQKEHDALAVHLYRNGISTTSNLFIVVRTVKTVKTAADRAAIVTAFMNSYGHNLHSNETLRPTVDIALAEAAMYLYGDYGYNRGSKLAYTRLSTNGDATTPDKVVGYVKADGYTLNPEGEDFLGWYLYDTGKKVLTGSPLSKLTKSHDGAMVVAKQYDAADADADGNMPAKYTIKVSTLTDLNLYTYNSTPVRTDVTLKKSSSFKVTLEYLDGDGVKWVYGSGTSTKDKKVSGWVKIGQAEAVDPTINKPIATATITASIVNVYPGATADGAPAVDTLKKDQVVNIYEKKVEQTEYGNKVWGKITYKDDAGNAYFGWINLANATVNDTKGQDASAEGQSGKIANTANANIRSTPEITTTNKIASLKSGTKVTILEMNADRTWAKIKWSTPANGYTQGWVYMHYVQLNSAPQGSTGSSNTTSKQEKILYTGVVTSNINLNVRAYQDVYAPRVGSLPTGTKVNVYETDETRNMDWGRIGEDEWVCLAYLKLTKVNNSSSSSSSAAGVTSTQGTVTTATLNILRNYNSNAEKLGELQKGDVVTILEKNTEDTETGSRIWGRIKKNGVEGWINLAYVDLKTVTTVAPSTGSGSSSSSSSSKAPTPAVISDCISVNVREEAGVYSRQITKLNNGTAVTVHEQTTYANAPWARIKWNNGANEGWVCMYYVTLNAGTGSNTNSDGILNGTSSNTISATGFVSNAYLNVRGGAGLGFAQIGTLNQGTKVTLFEQAVADGLIWGRISYNNTPGWVCMSYITLENASSTGKGVMGTIARCFAKANVRSAPGTNNALVSTVNVGSRVEVFEVRTHAAQKWGRIPQGWICMDYVLLDSELPEGEILDATTAPTTEATTAPEANEDQIVNREGEVAFVLEAITQKKLDVRNDANHNSTRVGTVNAGLPLDIRAVKNFGAELWGRIDQYATAGWIPLGNDTAVYGFDVYVNTDMQPVYVDANTNSEVKGTLSINTPLYIDKVTTDGTNVYGWVTNDIYGWIPMSKTSETKTDVLKVYKNGESVGDSVNAILSGTAFANMEAYDSIGGSKVLFKMEAGAVAHVAIVRFENGRAWAGVDCTEGNYGHAWFDLGKLNYRLTGTVTTTNLYARSSMDDSTTPEDEPNNIVGTALAGSIDVCQLAFDGYGNLWARITNNADNQLNGTFVKVMTASKSVFIAIGSLGLT